MPKPLSLFLDKSRWIAAFLVAYHHICWFVVGDSPTISWVDNPLIYLLVYGKNYGHSSVIVFFVISGYLVGGPIFFKIKQGGFSFSNYLVARFSRLYTVLVVAVLGGSGLDYWASTNWDEFGIYRKLADGKILMPNMVDTITYKNIAYSLVFCQKILAPIPGTNGPLWSLAYEWWYYILYPLILMIFLKDKIIYRGICLIAILGISAFLPRAIA